MASLNPKLLRAKEASNYLSISKSFFYELVAEGYLPKGNALRKRCVLWHVDDLNQFASNVASQEVGNV